MIEGFFRPRTLDEALQIRHSSTDTFWYAGGTSVNYRGAASGRAISLEYLNLDSISRDEASLRIGSMVSIQTLADSEFVFPVLKEAALSISSRNIRNMATVGGNIASMTPDSLLVPVLAALDAVLDTAENGTVSLDSYVRGNQGDLILSVSIPLRRQIAEAHRISRTGSSSSLVNTATVLNYEDDDSRLTSVRVVLNGIDGPVTRLKEVENAVLKGELTDRDQIQNEVSRYLNPAHDYRCSREYKIYIASVTVADSLIRSLERSL